MDSQKTISQEGGGVRYEKKMENILDRMWYMFPGWDRYAVVQRGELEQHWMISCMDSPVRNEMGIKSYKIYRHR